MRNKLGIVILAPATIIIGCGSDNTPVVVTPAEAAYVADTSMTANAIAYGALATDPLVVASPVPLALDQDAAVAAAAVQAASKNYSPAGCAVATATGGTVNYTFNNCTGPLGVTAMTGTASATFNVETDGIHVSMTSGGLKVGLDTVNLNRQGILGQNGTSRTFRVTGDTGSVTGPLGVVNHQTATGNLGWTIDSGCATYSSKETLTLNGVPLTTNYNNVSRCAGQCPLSGSVKIQDSSGGTVILTYGGSPNASFTESDGTAGTVPLTCGG